MSLLGWKLLFLCAGASDQKDSWLFSNEDPSVDKCLATFKREFRLFIHRAKQKRYIGRWKLGLIMYGSSCFCFLYSSFFSIHNIK
jgi:hypothetical protein